ncbi:MAG: hypothetical protein QM739_09070 [Propionivibrio sp.]
MTLTDRYCSAFKTILPALLPAQHRVLDALLFSPRHAMSAGHLRVVLGFKAVIEVNSAFGQLGRKVSELIGGHPEDLAEGEFQWWHILATGERNSTHGFVWTLRPEVVAALLACGFSENGDSFPNEVQSSSVLTEGTVRQVMVNAYERNPAARSRCVEAHGATCVVCGFDFSEVYGADAAGFIHVHHLLPLSSISAEYEVDPVADLCPVCPNCHAVIHMTNPPRSISDVKAMLVSVTTPNRAVKETLCVESHPED